jgi:SAM-dependent methyltransferase
MVSLHHMHEETCLTEIQEIKRILKPDGLLLIKEHNENTEKVVSFIEWEHSLYHIMDCIYAQQSVNGELFVSSATHHFQPNTYWQHRNTDGSDFELICRANRFFRRALSRR